MMDSREKELIEKLKIQVEEANKALSRFASENPEEYKKLQQEYPYIFSNKQQKITDSSH